MDNPNKNERGFVSVSHNMKRRFIWQLVSYIKRMVFAEVRIAALDPLNEDLLLSDTVREGLG